MIDLNKNINLKNVSINKTLKDRFKKLQTVAPETKDIKKDWIESELEAVKKAIYNFFKGLNIADRNKHRHYINSFEKLDNLFGLAYTSSSSYAGLWTCNENLYINETHYINGFYLTNDNKLCVNTWTDEEKEQDYIISQL